MPSATTESPKDVLMRFVRIPLEPRDVVNVDTKSLELALVNGKIAIRRDIVECGNNPTYVAGQVHRKLVFHPNMVSEALGWTMDDVAAAHDEFMRFVEKEFPVAAEEYKRQASEPKPIHGTGFVFPQSQGE